MYPSPAYGLGSGTACSHVPLCIVTTRPYRTSLNLSKSPDSVPEQMIFIFMPCRFVVWSIRGHCNKNIKRHTAYTIASWPNPKQSVEIHTSDLVMIIRQSMYILSIIKTGMGKLKTHSPTYCIMDNWENMLNLTHTLDKLHLTGIL